MKTWLKYALYLCIPLGIVVSVFMVIGTYPLVYLAYPAASLCEIVSQCNQDIPNGCLGCIIAVPIFGLIYGFMIGAIIGLIVSKIKSVSQKTNQE